MAHILLEAQTCGLVLLCGLSGFMSLFDFGPQPSAFEASSTRFLLEPPFQSVALAVTWFLQCLVLHTETSGQETWQYDYGSMSAQLSKYGVTLLHNAPFLVLKLCKSSNHCKGEIWIRPNHNHGHRYHPTKTITTVFQIFRAPITLTPPPLYNAPNQGKTPKGSWATMT